MVVAGAMAGSIESKALLSLIYSVQSSHSTEKETQINISVYFPTRLVMTIYCFKGCDGRARVQQGATGAHSRGHQQVLMSLGEDLGGHVA